MKRPNKEVLTGDFTWMENVHVEEHSRGTSPLQDIVEAVIWEDLTDSERELFLYRFGEQRPIRSIARELGYEYHSVVQLQLEELQRKVRACIERRLAAGDI